MAVSEISTKLRVHCLKQVLTSLFSVSLLIEAISLGSCASAESVSVGVCECVSEASSMCQSPPLCALSVNLSVRFLSGSPVAVSGAV